MINKDDDIKRYINSKYQKILGRDVDQSGMITFFNAIKTGKLLPRELESHLIESQEYKARSKSSPNKNVDSGFKSDSTRIMIEGASGTSDGYGICAETIATGLMRIANLSFFSRYNHSSNESSNILNKLKKDNSPDVNLFILPLYSNLIHGEGLLLHGPHRKSTAKKIIISMFETDTIPRAWHERFKSFDAIIFPSKFCYQIFKEQNNSIPSFYNPVGIRTDLYTPMTRAFPSNRKFRFLTYFSNHLIDDDRKNVISVIYAFNKRFGNNKDVELIIKTNNHSVMNVIGGLPNNIIIKREQMNRSEIISLLKTTDCLVFPSRGEGYGLPPREAMATGMPTIITNYSGLSDIADPNISFPINTKRLITAMFDQNIADNHNYGNKIFGRWADIDIDDIAEMMSHIYLNYDMAARIGSNGSGFIHSREGHLHCAESLLSIIKSIV